MIGWLGSICFMICGIPQVYQCIRDNTAKGVSLSFLLLWLLGEILCTIAIIMDYGFIWWILSNYAVNAACILIILFYKAKDNVSLL